MIDFVLAQVEQLEDAASVESQVLDSAILGEQFYFFTVVLMWLIHVGFMSYEAGSVRRKNVMATAMKNILTIAVVTPTFYYVGWWIYNCNQPGPADRPEFQRLHLGGLPGRHPLVGRVRAEPRQQHQPDLLPRLPALLLDHGVDHVRRPLERIRLSAYLVLASILGSVVWILDAAWGWSAGGWLTLRFGFHDSIASGVVHGVAGAFALGRGVQPRATNRPLHARGPDAPLPPAEPAHDPDGSDADLHRLLRLLRGLPGDRLHRRTGLGQHLPQPDHAGIDHDGHHVRLRRRLHRRILRQSAAIPSGRFRVDSRA